MSAIDRFDCICKSTVDIFCFSCVNIYNCCKYLRIFLNKTGVRKVHSLKIPDFLLPPSSCLEVSRISTQPRPQRIGDEADIYDEVFLRK